MTKNYFVKNLQRRILKKCNDFSLSTEDHEKCGKLLIIYFYVTCVITETFMFFTVTETIVRLFSFYQLLF